MGKLTENDEMRATQSQSARDASFVNAWLDAHHDDAVDASTGTSSPIDSSVELLLGQPEFADWGRDRVEQAVMYSEQDGMEESGSNLYEIHATEIVGWIGNGVAYCPDHISTGEAEAKRMQPVFASNEGWEDMLCDEQSDSLHTLGDAAGIPDHPKEEQEGNAYDDAGLPIWDPWADEHPPAPKTKLTPVDTKRKSQMKFNFESLIKNAVQNGIRSALNETSKPKVRKITRSQLAEGVRKALRMALKESGMPGGAMSAPGLGAGAPMAAPTQEGLSDGDVTKRGSSTFGQVPSPEELQQALDEQGGWSMDLKGADYFAFEYAMIVSGLSNPNMDTGTGMHAVLTALTNVPSPEELPSEMDDEEIENPHSQLNNLLNSWDARYGRHGEKIEDHAQSLASGILDMLGWEWI